MRRLPDLDFFVPDATKRQRRKDAVDAAVKEARHLLVVTHAKCLDGVGSYLVHALAAETPPPVLYVHPNEVHETIAWVARHQGNGRTLSINDLSFDKDEVVVLVQALERAKEAGWRIVWRDHHHTQWAGVDVGPIEATLDAFRLDRDAAECGTSLAQQDLLPDDPLGKELAAIVRDRDLWRNEDPRSEEYEFALRHMGTERFVEAFLATRDVGAPWIKAAAEDARKVTDEEVEAGVLSAEVFGDDHEVGFIYGEVPKNVTLHTLRNRRGTRLEINMKPDGTFSVRSAKGTDVAHLLGQAYGGGGHPNAAGGKARVPFWEWPTFWVKGGLSPAGMSVVRTALRLIAERDRDVEAPPEEGTSNRRHSREDGKRERRARDADADADADTAVASPPEGAQEARAQTASA